MNIVFRVDASTLIGSGHVMRCLTLADALKKRGNCIVFISRQLPGNLNDIIQKRNFKVIELPYDRKNEIFSNEKNNYEQFLSEKMNIEIQQSEELLDILKPDWVIVDHYSLDASWEGAMKNRVKKIMVIDDLANRKHICDLLLDQNYYVDSSIRYNALVSSHCRQLLGPKYALIKPAFLNIHDERKRLGKFNFEAIKKILIFMGGSDINNTTLGILQYLKKHSILQQYDISVIIGSINPNKEIIEKFCLDNDVLTYVFPVNFDEFLIQADLVIGAGGSSVYERCFSGIPSIVFSLAENQQKICKDVANAGAHIFIKKINELLSLFKKLNCDQLRLMYKNSRKLFIDYKGVEGVVDEIQSY